MSGLVHHPVFPNNSTFQKWDLFMPLDEKEGRLLLIGVLKRDNLSLLGCPVIEISTC
jgi:hypothetical protein